MRISNIYILFIVLFISSCARPYRKLSMSEIPFNEFRDEIKISYSIRQGVMYNTKNRFNKKKEFKKNVNLIAFKIINKTELPININDLKYYCGATIPLAPISIEEYYKTVKQKAELYWLYSPGVVVYPRPPKGSKKFIPLPFGIPLAAINYGVSLKANKKMMRDLQLLDLSNKVIQPQDSIEGILTFKNVDNCGDIYISVKEN